jgi:Acetyltransferase (GNAT) domain
MNLSITHITSLEGLRPLRSSWTALQAHPNADFEQFLLVCRLRPEIVSPLVLVVERNAAVCALLVARIERRVVTPQIGYFRPFGITANVVSAIHQGLMGDIDDEVALALWTRLRLLLSSGEAEMAVLHNFAESSPLSKVTLARTPLWWWEPTVRWSTHWTMTLTEAPDVLFRKLRSKHRSSLRARLKGLEALGPGQVRWRWISEFDDIPGLCQQIESVAAGTYQRGLGVGFFDNEEHRGRFAIFAERRELRVQLLEIGGRVFAYWIGLVFESTFHSWATGYRPELTEFDPGTLTFARMLDELAKEGVEVFDFGLGEAHYKVRFGDASWREASPMMFAPSLKALAIRLMLSGSSLVDAGARRLLTSLQILDSVKTAWRRRVRLSSTPKR